MFIPTGLAQIYWVPDSAPALRAVIEGEPHPTLKGSPHFAWGDVRAPLDGSRPCSVRWQAEDRSRRPEEKGSQWTVAETAGWHRPPHFSVGPLQHPPSRWFTSFPYPTSARKQIRVTVVVCGLCVASPLFPGQSQNSLAVPKTL